MNNVTPLPGIQLFNLTGRTALITGGLALDAQVGGGRIRMLRPRLGHLQQAEVVLGAVVGCQRGVEQRRQEQTALAEGVDDMGFFHGGIRRIHGIVATAGYGMMSAGDKGPGLSHARHQPLIKRQYAAPRLRACRV